MKTFRAFWGDESGSTAMEYALIGGLISIIIVGSATAIGTKLSAKFTPISGNLN